MELQHQGGPEAESLLRPGQRNPNIMSQANRQQGWDGDGEKSPFLRNEPVKLTPAWEGTNLPNDTLNLKDVTMDLAPPKDRYNLVYFTLMLHGLGTLTAWNMFITARNYFIEYKLVTEPTLMANFLVYIGYASQLPNFFFSWFNLFVTLSGNLTTRIIWCLMAEVMVFVVTVVLAMLDSTQWTVIFFWLTMLSVFVLNAFNAVFQNSVFGVAARLPPKYTGAVVLGSNICGTIVVLLNWLTDVTGGSYRTSAIYYFIGGMFVLLICFDTYFALPLNRFYRYYDTLEQRTMRVNPALAATSEDPGRARKQTVPYMLILRQCWVQLFNIFITFFVTLACFPAVQAEIAPVQTGFLGDNFVRFTCFLTFNVFATLGNVTASLWQFPSRNWLSIFTSLRLLFIPLFLLCNYMPRRDSVSFETRTLPVFINNDYVYWALSVLMAWSSGHGSSLGLMYVGGKVSPEYASKAGMLGGATLITGIITGIGFSSFARRIVTSDVWLRL